MSVIRDFLAPGLMCKKSLYTRLFSFGSTLRTGAILQGIGDKPGSPLTLKGWSLLSSCHYGKELKAVHLVNVGKVIPSKKVFV